MNAATSELSIRPFQEGDEAEVVGVWHRSGRAGYTFLPTWQEFGLDTARKVFREVIRPRCDIWVGVRDGRIVAYLAMNGSRIDRMYVDPGEWRKGWGTRLVELAKKLSPDGLELHTHQQNASARAFYERHGFVAVKFGISPAPERAPDVEYHWRPTGNKVLASLENSHGDYCVDIFVRPDGSFGFEEYRRDPEDGVWRCLHRYSSQAFNSEEAAVAEAKGRVPWLGLEGA